MADRGDELAASIRDAAESGQRLVVRGSGSKPWLTATCEGEVLSVAGHTGVMDYRPEELVLTARAGTALDEIEAVLAENGQHLAFEPPRIGGGGTLGGAVAAGLSGPGRPWRGSVRDAVLGVTMINGYGEMLAFGGQVMKNVAGYDVSRLQAGAYGTLGVLLSVSVRVQPSPECERTLHFEQDAPEALATMRDWARLPWPVSATLHERQTLSVRLSGSHAGVAGAVAELGGECSDDLSLWDQLRDRGHRLFGGPVLWRASYPPAAPLQGDECAMEWGGAQRWYRSDVSEHVRAQRGWMRRADAPGQLPGGTYSARIKKAFDPQGVLNASLNAHTGDGEASDAH